MYEPYSERAWFYSAPGPEDTTQTAQMLNFVHTFVDQKGVSHPLLNGMNGNKWGMVHAWGVATDPLWHMAGVPDFHAPEAFGSWLTNTSDSPFVVVDQAQGITVGGGKASVTGPHTITASGLAYFVHGTNGVDRRRTAAGIFPKSDSTVNFSSRGRVPDTMLVTRAEADFALAHATGLGHPLEIFWAETDSNAGFKYPMVGAEGGKAGWGAEGQRIALKPTTDLSACNPMAKVIALTLEQNGAYIGDNAGGAAAIKVEQEATGHDVWGTTLSQNDLSCITWDDFYVAQY